MTAALAELPKFARRVKGQHVNVAFLLPSDTTTADVRFLASIWDRSRADRDSDPDIDWVTRWEDVRTPLVVSFGKEGLEAWHRWGIVRVSDHGTVFLRPNNLAGTWVMVCEHPGAVAQQTAWGYGVKEHLMEELGWLGAGNVVSDRLGVKCLQCWHKRDGKRVEVAAYNWDVDGIAQCDRHWSRRAEIKLNRAVRKRVDKSKPEAQLVGQTALL